MHQMQSDILRLQQKIRGLESKLRKAPTNITVASVDQSNSSIHPTDFSAQRLPGGGPNEVLHLNFQEQSVPRSRPSGEFPNQDLPWTAGGTQVEPSSNSVQYGAGHSPLRNRSTGSHHSSSPIIQTRSLQARQKSQETDGFGVSAAGASKPIGLPQGISSHSRGRNTHLQNDNGPRKPIMVYSSHNPQNLSNNLTTFGGDMDPDLQNTRPGTSSKFNQTHQIPEMTRYPQNSGQMRNVVLDNLPDGSSTAQQTCLKDPSSQNFDMTGGQNLQHHLQNSSQGGTEIGIFAQSQSMMMDQSQLDSQLSFSASNPQYSQPSANKKMVHYLHELPPAPIPPVLHDLPQGGLVEKKRKKPPSHPTDSGIMTSRSNSKSVGPRSLKRSTHSRGRGASNEIHRILKNQNPRLCEPKSGLRPQPSKQSFAKSTKPSTSHTSSAQIKQSGSIKAYRQNSHRSHKSDRLSQKSHYSTKGTNQYTGSRPSGHPSNHASNHASVHPSAHASIHASNLHSYQPSHHKTVQGPRFHINSSYCSSKKRVNESFHKMRQASEGSRSEVRRFDSRFDCRLSSNKKSLRSQSQRRGNQAVLSQSSFITASEKLAHGSVMHQCCEANDSKVRRMAEKYATVQAANKDLRREIHRLQGKLKYMDELNRKYQHNKMAYGKILALLEKSEGIRRGQNEKLKALHGVVHTLKRQKRDLQYQLAKNFDKCQTERGHPGKKEVEPAEKKSRNLRIRQNRSQRHLENRNLDDDMISQMIKIQNLHHGLKQTEIQDLQNRSRTKESLSEFIDRRRQGRNDALRHVPRPLSKRDNLRSRSRQRNNGAQAGYSLRTQKQRSHPSFSLSKGSTSKYTNIRSKQEYNLMNSKRIRTPRNGGTSREASFREHRQGIIKTCSSQNIHQFATQKQVDISHSQRSSYSPLRKRATDLPMTSDELIDASRDLKSRLREELAQESSIMKASAEWPSGIENPVVSTSQQMCNEAYKSINDYFERQARKKSQNSFGSGGFRSDGSSPLRTKNLFSERLGELRATAGAFDNKRSQDSRQEMTAQQQYFPETQQHDPDPHFGRNPVTRTSPNNSLKHRYGLPESNIGSYQPHGSSFNHESAIVNIPVSSSAGGHIESQQAPRLFELNVCPEEGRDLTLMPPSTKAVAPAAESSEMSPIAMKYTQAMV